MLKIQKMTLENVDDVHALEQDIFSVPWSKHTFRASLARPNIVYFVAIMSTEEKDKVVGYCGYLQVFEEADITNVAVDMHYRNRGIAKKLIQHLIDYGTQQGITTFMLEVRDSNKAAIHLYETCGFSTIGMRKQYYEKPVEDAFIMQYR